jgi:hypothetical protein
MQKVSSPRLRISHFSSTSLIVIAALSTQPPKVFAQNLGQAVTADRRVSSSPLDLPESASKLPEEPRPQSSSHSEEGQMIRADGAASISGVVHDITDATVAGAQISLTDASGAQRRTISGPNGEFAFNRVPMGAYRVRVEARDLEPFQSAEIVVSAQQVYDVPRILLPVARANTSVTVRPTEEVAAQQVKAEERQRIAGIVPSFYTSYVYDAAPLTTKQKYALASHELFDPISFVGVGISAGIGQATNMFGGYGQGAAGYGKRYAAAYGDTLTSSLLSHAVFPAIFHQDPRYFYQGTGSKKSRLVHALSFAVIARSDSGRDMPNYSYLLGDIGSGLLSNLYYPHADRGVGLVFTDAALGIGGRAAGTVIREFLLRKITKNVPDSGKTP